MKKLAKRTAVTALVGVMAAGLLSGCGEKKVDGTQTAATVNGEEIPMGLISLSARYQQAQTEAMYRSFMGGGTAAIWDNVVDEETDETYGQRAVKDVLKATEICYLLRAKAADYYIELTEEEQTAIDEAAAAFMEANTEETIEAISVSEDQVKLYLELQTYEVKMKEALTEEAKIEITDEEAQQSGFTYVNVNISDESMTDEDKEAKKEQAQQILDKMLEDPEADMSEIAKEVDDTLSALEGTFTTNLGEDEEESASYPEEVMEVLRGLEVGEVGPEVIETDGSYYVVRLDTDFDEDATESKKESLKTTKENEYYTETTEKWLEEAEVTEDDKVLETLVVSDSHTFTIQVPETEEEDTEAAAEETGDETEAEAEVEDLEAEEDPQPVDEEEEAELESITEVEDIDLSETDEAADDTAADEADTAAETAEEETE